MWAKHIVIINSDRRVPDLLNELKVKFSKVSDLKVEAIETSSEFIVIKFSIKLNDNEQADIKARKFKISTLTEKITKTVGKIHTKNSNKAVA